MKIMAAVSRGVGTAFVVEELDLEEPRADEIQVRILATGICHTDLVFRDRPGLIDRPVVLGHEGSGIVERVGSNVVKVKPGDRVVLTFHSCGTCGNCTADAPAYCEEGLALNNRGSRADGSKSLSKDGVEVGSNFFGQSSFASHALCYERNVVGVENDDIPFELLAPLGCSIQTGAGAVLTSLACRPSTTILICGAGAVGLSAVMAARVAGCGRILVSDPIESRRQIALELGATDVFNPACQDLASAVRAALGGGCHYVLDTTGRSEVLEGGLACLNSKGVLGIIGMPAETTPLPGTALEVLSRGLTIRGILEGDSCPDAFIPQLLGLWRNGRLPYDRLVTTFPLSEINEAVQAVYSGDVVKGVIVMPHGTA